MARSLKAAKVAADTRIVRAARAQLPGPLLGGVIRQSIGTPSRLEIQAFRHVRDLEASAKRVLVHRAGCEATVSDGTWRVDGLRWACGPAVGSGAASATSPSGALVVTFSTDKGTAAGGKAKRFLVVTDVRTQSLVRSIDVTAAHGAFVGDDDFGGVSWTAGERALVYVAERNAPKRESSEREGWAFAEKESFGELTGGMQRPGVFVASLVSGRVCHVRTDVLASEWAGGGTAVAAAASADAESARAVAPLAAAADGKLKDAERQRLAPAEVVELSAGQPQVGGAAGAEWLLLSAMVPLPQRLGSAYCINRPWAVVACPLDLDSLHVPAEDAAPADGGGDASAGHDATADGAGAVGDAAAGDEASVSPYLVRLSPPDRWCRSARVSPDGRTAVWLATPAGILTHSAGSALCKVDWAEAAAAAAAEAGLAAVAAAAESGAARPEGCAAAFADASPAVDRSTAELVPRLHEACRGAVLRADGDDAAGDASATGPALGGALFAGLYLNTLPRRCFVRGGSGLLAHSAVGFRQDVLLVSLADGAVSRCVPNPSDAVAAGDGRAWGTPAPGDARPPASLTLLDVTPVGSGDGAGAGDVALVAGSSFTAPDTLGLVVVGAGGAWERVWSPAEGNVDGPEAAAFAWEGCGGPRGEAAALPCGASPPALNRTAGGGHAAVSAEDPDVLGALRGARTTTLRFWRRSEAPPVDDVAALEAARASLDDGPLVRAGEGPGAGPMVLVESVLLEPAHGTPVPERRAGLAEPDSAEPDPAGADGAAPRPLVVVAHGGPHSAFAATLSSNVAAMLARGYGVLLVNYRGSLGYGERSVNSLPGLAGWRDVDDCDDARREAMRARPRAFDPRRVAFWGGSHSGFIGGHLIGRPGWAAGVLRNPVIDVAAMASATDIPEWCLAEGAAMAMPPGRTVPPDAVRAMYACSPIAALPPSAAPTLLGIGGGDLRVPPFNSRLLHHALRARGVPSRLLCYPEDSHPMSSLDADADFSANAFAWMTHFV